MVHNWLINMLITTKPNIKQNQTICSFPKIGVPPGYHLILLPDFPFNKHVHILLVNIHSLLLKMAKCGNSGFTWIYPFTAWGLSHMFPYFPISFVIFISSFTRPGNPSRWIPREPAGFCQHQWQWPALEGANNPSWDDVFRPRSDRWCFDISEMVYLFREPRIGRKSENLEIKTFISIYSL
jgi:hypothetical protein